MSDFDPSAPLDAEPTPEAALASSQSLDLNGDGYVDAITVGNSDGTTDVFTDQDENGRFEGAVRYRWDGTVAAVLQDADEDGDYDVAVVDQTGNGVLDTTAVDTTGDGRFDTVVTDLNENGVADGLEVPATGQTIDNGGWSFHPRGDSFPVDPVTAASPSIVGPVTNPDPMYTFFVNLAGETGQAVFGPADSDHDGWTDGEDSHPGDPFRH